MRTRFSGAFNGLFQQQIGIPICPGTSINGDDIHCNVPVLSSESIFVLN
jgi:hypothetical protein